MRISDWSSDVCSSDLACGPGNNGGDGYVLARHAREAGRQVRVLRLPGHAPRSEIAMRAERAYRDAGGSVEEFGDSIGDADLVVDALFGIGLEIGRAHVLTPVPNAPLRFRLRLEK